MWKTKVDSILDTAFGVNTEPTWDDFLEFLASRCIPKLAAALATTLMRLAVPEYDPVQLVEKDTEDGWRRDHKMAQDHLIFHTNDRVVTSTSLGNQEKVRCKSLWYKGGQWSF